MIPKIRKMLLTPIPLKSADGGVVVKKECMSNWALEFEIHPTKLIFPTREGEYIDEPDKIAIGSEYSLTYPGTASMKCIVIYQEDYNLFIGGEPSYEYAQIVLHRVSTKKFHLKFISRRHHFIIIPFTEKWTNAINLYRSHFKLTTQKNRTSEPRYMLQLGIKDSFKNVYIKHFNELKPAIEQFRNNFGSGNIIHFFGTNKDGFDRMFPDYTIDPALGGAEALKDLLHFAESLNLQTSHHYNPRIADSNWIKQFPEYQPAIVKKDGKNVLEPYKDHPHFVMNLNTDIWFKRCFETVHYLKNLGFSYLEIDQFTYQRNFYQPESPLALGYKRMIDEFIRLGINFWLEGVSDIFRLPAGNFYQILIRDKSQLWENNENRRGYPYGKTHAQFFMSLHPDSEVSYQIFTEHKLFDLLSERFNSARQNKAFVYDIELGFYDKDYLNNLNRVISILKENGKI